MKGQIKLCRRGSRLARDSDAQNDSAVAVSACQAVLSLLKEDRGQIETFQAEDGPTVIYELLQDPCSEKVIFFSEDLKIFTPGIRLPRWWNFIAKIISTENFICSLSCSIEAFLLPLELHCFHLEAEAQSKKDRDQVFSVHYRGILINFQILKLSLSSMCTTLADLGPRPKIQDNQFAFQRKHGLHT